MKYQRCNGQHPSCSACLQTNRKCHYTPVLNTIEQLESRVEELQDQLRAATVSQANAAAGSAPSFGELTLQTQARRPVPLASLVVGPATSFIPQVLSTWYPGQQEMPQRLRLQLCVPPIQHFAINILTYFATTGYRRSYRIRLCSTSISAFLAFMSA